MIIRNLFQDEHGRTVLSIPAYLRDHFELKSGDKVDVGLEGERIVITPLKEKKED